MKSARQVKGITSLAMAHQVGISRSYITLIETGKRLPSIRRLPKLAKVLGIRKHLIVSWYITDLEARLRKL